MIAPKPKQMPYLWYVANTMTYQRRKNVSHWWDSMWKSNVLSHLLVSSDNVRNPIRYVHDIRCRIHLIICIAVDITVDLAAVQRVWIEEVQIFFDQRQSE
jgi:hypothetical protein